MTTKQCGAEKSVQGPLLTLQCVHMKAANQYSYLARTPDDATSPRFTLCHPPYLLTLEHSLEQKFGRTYHCHLIKYREKKKPL